MRTSAGATPSLLSKDSQGALDVRWKGTGSDTPSASQDNARVVSMTRFPGPGNGSKRYDKVVRGETPSTPVPTGIAAIPRTPGASKTRTAEEADVSSLFLTVIEAGVKPSLVAVVYATDAEAPGEAATEAGRIDAVKATPESSEALQAVDLLSR